MNENIKSSNSINISYPFSPPIADTRLPDNLVKEIADYCNEIWEKELKSGEKNGELEYGDKLVGRNFSEINIREILDKSGAAVGICQVAAHFLNSTQVLLNPGQPLLSQDIRLVGAWANLSLPNYDYNPIHMHPDCLLTTVGYLEVPDWKKMRMAAEKQKVTKFQFKDGHPGSLVLLPEVVAKHSPFVPHAINIIPEVSKYYMFPANIKHCVYPYPDGYGYRKSFVVNISLSAEGFRKTNIPQFCKTTSFGMLN